MKTPTTTRDLARLATRYANRLANAQHQLAQAQSRVDAIHAEYQAAKAALDSGTTE